jgi:3-oxoacyl-[acyl-carrier protein] reductase
MLDFEDKVVVISGAGHAKGMGRAAAVKFAEYGARVVVTDLVRDDHRTQDMASIEHVAETIRSAGGEAIAVPVDVTDRRQVAACVDATLDAFRTIDILINNAGTGIGAGPFLEQTDRQWEISFRVHMMGALYFCQAVIPIMQASGGGVIVNNSSVLGLAAEPFTAAYTATKFGVVGLTKVIASEFGGDNIRCNAVCPGSVDTRMQADGIKQIAQWTGTSEQEALAGAERNALGRSGSADEIADVMVWLASPMSSFVSGAAIPVTGAANPGV